MIEMKLITGEAAAGLFAGADGETASGEKFAYAAFEGGEEKGVCVFTLARKEARIYLLKTVGDDLSIEDALLRAALYFLLRHGAFSAVFSAWSPKNASAGQKAVLKALGFQREDNLWTEELTPAVFSHCK